MLAPNPFVVVLFSLTGTFPAVAQWEEQFGTPRFDSGVGVATDASGGVYVAGNTYGNLGNSRNVDRSDAYVRKYGDGGWTKQFGISGARFVFCKAVTVHESFVYVVGETELAGGDINAWVAQFDGSYSCERTVFFEVI